MSTRNSTTFNIPGCTLQRHVCIPEPGRAHVPVLPTTNTPLHPPLLLYDRLPPQQRVGKSNQNNASSSLQSTVQAAPRPSYVAHRLVPTSTATEEEMSPMIASSGIASSTTVASDISEMIDDVDAAYLDARTAMHGKASLRRTLFVTHFARVGDNEAALAVPPDVHGADSGFGWAALGRGALGDVNRLALILSLLDLVLVLYSVLSTRWISDYSPLVIAGMVATNALFIWAIRGHNVAVITAVTVLLPSNFALIFSVDTTNVMLARLLVVVGEISVLVALRSLIEPAVFFL